MRRVVVLTSSKVPAEVRTAIDAVVCDLEQYGRTTTTNHKAARYLQHKMREHKRMGLIYFRWLNDYNPQKSLIALEKGYGIKRLSDNKLKVVNVSPK